MDNDLTFLIGLSEELAELSPQVDLHVVLAKHVQQYSGAMFVVCTDYDPLREALITRHVEASQALLEGVVQVAGPAILNTVSPLSRAISKEILRQEVAVHQSLHQASFGAVPKLVEKAIKKLCGLDYCIGVSYSIGGELFGTSILGMKKGQAAPSISILKAYAHFAAVALRRRKSEEDLLRNKEKYRMLIEMAPDGFLHGDPSGNFIEANNKAIEMTGYSREELKRMNVKDLFPAAVLKDKPLNFNALANGQVITAERWIRCRNGQLLPVEMTSRQMPDGTYQSLLRDISDRVAAMETIREKESQYSQLIERMPDGFYKSTPDGRFIDVNPALVKMLGYTTRDELMAIDIPSQLYFDPTDRESLVLAENLEELGVYSLKKKDGSALWVEDHGWYQMDAHGNILFHEGIIRDYTEQKQAFDALRESEEKYRVFINATKDMAYLKDDKFHYLLVNEANARFFGKDGNDIIGKSDYDLMPMEAAANCQASDLEAIKSSTVVISEESLGNKIYETHKFRVPLVNGGWGVGAYIRDITDRKRSESLLARQTEELKELNATKDKFFSIIAHDLKNPFNAILGYLDIMKTNFDDLERDDIKKIIVVLGNSSKQAYNLLENLLLWARSQTGKIEFQQEVLNMKATVSESIAFLEGQARSKEIQLENTIRGNYLALADKNMSGVILRNLLSNAIKFTPRGGQVRVSAEKLPGFIELGVIDSGVGIMPDHLDKIFRIDCKTSTLGTEKEKGSGLGLILCKEFTKMQGGSIWVESKPGLGSSFYFTLPSE